MSSFRSSVPLRAFTTIQQARVLRKLSRYPGLTHIVTQIRKNTDGTGGADQTLSPAFFRKTVSSSVKKSRVARPFPLRRIFTRRRSYFQKRIQSTYHCRDGPSGAEALTASSGEGASIASSGRFPPYCSLGKNFRTGQISILGLNLSWH